MLVLSLFTNFRHLLISSAFLFHLFSVFRFYSSFCLFSLSHSLLLPLSLSLSLFLTTSFSFIFFYSFYLSLIFHSLFLFTNFRHLLTPAFPSTFFASFPLSLSSLSFSFLPLSLSNSLLPLFAFHGKYSDVLFFQLIPRSHEFKRATRFSTKCYC